jgi:hypothetical protein
VDILFQHFLKQKVQALNLFNLSETHTDQYVTLRGLIAFAKRPDMITTRRPAGAFITWKEMLETWLHLLESEASGLQGDNTDTRPADEYEIGRRNRLSSIARRARADLATEFIVKEGSGEDVAIQVHSNKKCRDTDESPAIQDEEASATNKAPNPCPDISNPRLASLVEEKHEISIGCTNGMGQAEEAKAVSKEDASQDQQSPSQTSLLSGRSSPSALVR